MLNPATGADTLKELNQLHLAQSVALCLVMFFDAPKFKVCHEGVF